jgi:hypothetical protein
MSTPSYGLVQAIKTSLAESAAAGLQFIKQSNQQSDEEFRSSLVKHLIEEFCKQQEIQLVVPDNSEIQSLEQQISSLKQSISEQKDTLESIRRKKLQNKN